jgi:hypothetical protein
MLESAKNASGQEAFARKGKETPVEQSPTASTTDVTSQALGAGAKMMLEVEKCGASTASPVGGRQDDLCVFDPLPTLGQQIAEVGGTSVEGDDDRCLYARTPWENDVITDYRDVNEFKKASRTITWTLSVRAQTCFCDF